MGARTRGAFEASTGLGSTRSSRQPSTCVADTLIGLIVQKCIQGVAQIRLLRVVLALALDVLVVDGAPVADAAESVEQEGLAGPLDQDRIADQVLLILQDREVDPRLADVLGEVLLGLMGIGVDAEEDDPLVTISAIQFDQPGDVEIADRTVRPEEKCLLAGIAALAGFALSAL